MAYPKIILKDHLLMPLIATEARIEEARRISEGSDNGVILNGLFVMSFSYLESMVKEILGYYFRYDLRAMPDFKSIKIQESFAEAGNFFVLESLVTDYLERKRFSELLGYLYKALKVKKPHNHQAIEHIRERRNELVHKNLTVDFKHGHPKEQYIGRPDLAQALDEYSAYVTNLRKQIATRYAECTRLNALKKLWQWTFRTPLCANFDDYWYTDVDLDSIVGYKTSCLEGSLSSGETFMLSMWRSQVCNYDVEFPNMSTLGPHFRSSLYMLLKLSDDLFFYETPS